MSDDIRVYSGGGQGDKPRGSRAEALKRFKRGRRAGDLVQGVFLRLAPVPPGTAWVNLEGSPLLAALPDDLADLAGRVMAGQGAGATPTGVTEADFPIKNGQVCHFILEAVEPEPMLRMLGVSDPKSLAATAAEARRLSLERLPLAQLAALYTRQRTLLDNLLHRDLWQQKDLEIPFPASPPPALTLYAAEASAPPAVDPESPPGRYAAFIAQGEAHGYFAELEAYRRALLENLRPYGLLGFLFVPWLCPAAFGLELAFTRQGISANSAGSAARDGGCEGDGLQGRLCRPQQTSPRASARQDVGPSVMCGDGAARDGGCGAGVFREEPEFTSANSAKALGATSERAGGFCRRSIVASEERKKDERPARASARQDVGPSVIYRLQGLFANEAARTGGQEGLASVRRELSGNLGGSFARRSPGPGDPDLLSRILALKPEEARTAFNRRA